MELDYLGADFRIRARKAAAATAFGVSDRKQRQRTVISHQ